MPAERMQLAWPAKGTTSTAAVVALVVAVAILVSAPPLTVSAAAVIGIATIVLALINPLFGLGALIFSIPFSTLGQSPTGGVEMTSTELIIGILVATWLGKGIRQRDLRITPGPLAAPIMLFIGLVFLSMTYSPSLPLSLKELLKWLELLVVYLFVVNNITDQRQLKAILVALALAAIGEAAIGYYQFLGRVGPDGFKIGGFLRAYGTFGQPNPFAGYLTSMAILSLALGLVPLVKREGNLFILFSLGSLGFLSLAIFMSMSRGAWLGFALGAVVVAAVASRSTQIALVSLALLLSLVLLAGSFNLLPYQFSGRISESLAYFRLFDASRVNPDPDNWAMVERMANWQAAWGMHERYPWLGVGVGNFAIAYPDFALKFWKEPKGHAHNVYLNTLAEMGIVGLGAYLLLLAIFFFHAGRAVWHTGARLASAVRTGGREVGQKYTLYAAVAIGLLGTLVGISVHNQFDSLFVHGLNAQIGLVLGLITVVDRLSREAGDTIKTARGGIRPSS